MSYKTGWACFVLSFLLFLAAVGTKYLCVVHGWDPKGLDYALVLFSVAVAGFGGGVLITLGAKKDADNVQP